MVITLGLTVPTIVVISIVVVALLCTEIMAPISLQKFQQLLLEQS